MSKGKWWLITWTTYATWLPGDPRGFQTWQGREYVPPPKRYAKPGETTYNPADYKERHNEAREIAEEPVYLTPEQRQIAIDAIVAEIATMPMRPAVMAVGEVHAHLLARFGALRIRNAIGRIKAAATQSLHVSGIESERVWSRNEHMKSKAEGHEFRTAFDYVLRHEKEGAAVYVWDEFR